MEAYSLYDLNEYIRRVIALNFPESIWITCEISSAKNSRGNLYIDLIQQNENDEVIAQGSAVLWYRNFIFLKSKLGELIDAILKDGTEVKIKVSIDYNERYGLKLVIEDIDPTYTLGQMELARKKILERLRNEGVLELNKEKTIPTVIQKIAVISAETAAGYIDFKEHLNNNAFGYAYKISLFQAALQGQNTEKEVVNALREISEIKEKFDVVVIIRGGGSKLDLAAFDNYNIGIEIAKFPLPILTGIGHEIDNTIADMVAFESLKTPTAVANFIIDRSQLFETSIDILYENIFSQIKEKIRHENEKLNYVYTLITQQPKTMIETHKLNINYLYTSMLQLKNNVIQQHRQRLGAFHQMIEISKPENILKRGFVMVKSGDQFLTSKADVGAIENAEIQFHDGKSEIKFLK